MHLKRFRLGWTPLAGAVCRKQRAEVAVPAALRLGTLLTPGRRLHPLLAGLLPPPPRPMVAAAAAAGAVDGEERPQKENAGRTPACKPLPSAVAATGRLGRMLLQDASN